jgi:hypothetical protein
VFDAALAKVISVLILSVLSWVFYGGFVRRPKIEVKFTHKPASGLPDDGRGDLMPVRWNYELRFTNVSPYDAFEVQLVTRKSRAPISSPGFGHLKSGDSFEIDGTFTGPVIRDEAKASGGDFHGSLLPKELKDLRLVICYRNKYKFRFCTVYTKPNGKQSNRYCISELLTDVLGAD